MIDVPTTTLTTERLTAVVRHTIPRADIQKVMGPAIAAVIAAVTAQGIGPVGPVYARHFRMDPAVFDFEVGVSVSAQVKPTGPVVASTLPSVKVVRTIYRGPYEGLATAWSEFDKWISAHRLLVTGESWEYYAKGPESGPDATAWETELVRPLR